MRFNHTAPCAVKRAGIVDEREGDKPRQGVVANTLDAFGGGAAGLKKLHDAIITASIPDKCVCSCRMVMVSPREVVENKYPLVRSLIALVNCPRIG